jgi:hypothetical protein
LNLCIGGQLHFGREEVFALRPLQEVVVRGDLMREATACEIQLTKSSQHVLIEVPAARFIRVESRMYCKQELTVLA